MNVTGKPLAVAREECLRLQTMSVPQLFQERVRESGDYVTIRYKDKGIYHELTWAQYYDRARHIAAHFIKFGLERGETIAVMSDPTIEYVLTQMAAILAGAVPYGIYPTCSRNEVEFLFNKGGARIAVAGDQEHLDKFLEAERKAGQKLIQKILLIDARTKFVYDDPRIVAFDDLLDDEDGAVKCLSEVDRRMAAAKPDDIIGMIFTSGTTADPKGAYYTHAGMLVGLGYGMLEVMPDLRARPHRIITHLPLAHGMGLALSLLSPLMADLVQHLPERGKCTETFMREVRPTHFVAVPRIFQKTASQLFVEIANGGHARQAIFNFAERIGEKVAEARCKGRLSVTDILLRPVNWFLYATVIWPALYKIGLAHVTGAGSGGAPTPNGVIRRWQSWGIPLRNIYGCTEGGMLGGAEGLWAEPGGKLVMPFPRKVVQAADNEVLAQGFGTFGGYWRDDQATAAVFDANGRVMTGDVAEYFDDGTFRIVDRKKDILITSGGKNVSPATVETALKTSPYISEAVIFGDGEKYLTALIEVNFESLASWARANDVQYTGFTNLIENERTIKLIDKEIQSSNRLLARPEQIKYFRIIPKELDPEDGDTTATRKIKRAHAYNMFKDLVHDMYRAN